MHDEQWRQFFTLCVQLLGRGDSTPERSKTWCAWTTFTRLSQDAGYWTSGLPNEPDIGFAGIGDGGVWGQPFPYRELAHLIVPAQFYWERVERDDFASGTKTQDLARLSAALGGVGVTHRLTDLVLEIKLY